MSANPSYQKVLLAANTRHDSITAQVPGLVDSLNKQKIEVSVWQEQPDPSCLKDVDLVLVLGGDGYMMSVIRALDYPAIPFYGLNYGRVGFLMSPPAEPQEVAQRIAKDDFHKTEHPVLQGAITRENGESVIVNAFNDIVLERASGQTVHMQTFIDEVWLNQYSGDGLIVSTPGGSTAYSLAAGGPVIHHEMQGMLVTPLNPHRPVQFHSLQFPVFLPEHSTIQIVAEYTEKRPVRCTADGVPVDGVKDISITCSESKAHLLRLPEFSYIQTLVEKIIGMGG